MKSQLTPAEVERYLADIKRRGNYIKLKMLKDGTVVGVGHLMFTTALYVDLDLNGWGNRYCYKSHEVCIEQYDLMNTGDLEPTGWIATR